MIGRDEEDRMAEMMSACGVMCSGCAFVKRKIEEPDATVFDHGRRSFA
jgi:hypothetical protein